MSGQLRCFPELPSSLPPADAWKRDPGGLLRTPVPADDRGFVLPEETIEVVLAYFEQDYIWPVDWSKNAPQILRPDDHHFHWMAAHYRKQLFCGPDASVPAKFRDLPTNRGILPRQFHNVLHKYTLPPDVPRLGDMARYLESFEIARQLFRSAERALRVNELFERADSTAELEKYIRRYDEIFDTYNRTKYKALGTQALHIIGEVGIDTESLSEVFERLGSCALLNVPNYTQQYFAPVEAAA